MVANVAAIQAAGDFTVTQPGTGTADSTGSDEDALLRSGRLPPAPKNFSMRSPPTARPSSSSTPCWATSARSSWHASRRRTAKPSPCCAEPPPRVSTGSDRTTYCCVMTSTISPWRPSPGASANRTRGDVTPPASGRGAERRPRAPTAPRMPGSRKDPQAFNHRATGQRKDAATVSRTPSSPAGTPDTANRISAGRRPVGLLYTSDAADEEDSVDLGG